MPRGRRAFRFTSWLRWTIRLKTGEILRLFGEQTKNHVSRGEPASQGHFQDQDVEKLAQELERCGYYSVTCSVVPSLVTALKVE